VSANAPRIECQEYLERQTRLQESVAKAELDLFLVSSFESIYYLTGAGFEPLERPFFLLVRPDHDSTLLVPKLDHEHMKKAHGIDAKNIHTYWEYPAPAGRNWRDRLHEEMGNAKSIGVEPSLPLEIAQELRDYSPRVEPLVERLRLIKSPSEIAMIRRAAHYADMGLQRLLSASYLHATAAEGFAETRHVTAQIIRDLDDWDPLTTKVIMATWAARWSAMPHCIPNLNDRLREGPHVALVLTRVNGYAAESERTYFTKEPSERDRSILKQMEKARELAFSNIKPGKQCAEIDAEVNDFLRSEGHSSEDERLHRTGHGFGLGNHEAPWLAEGSIDVLQPNMIISIEPGIYLHDIGGFRHSDTVLITDKEPWFEVLTSNFPHASEPMVIRWPGFSQLLKSSLVRSKLRVARKHR
jgi:Xaa-Pro dipeptidase